MERFIRSANILGYMNVVGVFSVFVYSLSSNISNLKIENDLKVRRLNRLYKPLHPCKLQFIIIPLKNLTSMTQ